jgi:EAL domain-containing protein (putative c-di-GMP-specific phosphodiesterase class I)
MAPVEQIERVSRYERVREVLADAAISPVYQPIVELKSGRPIAYEALSRFPGDDAYTADRWFADAWEFGLGVELELLAARVTAEALPELPPQVALCINASPAAIATDQFLPYLRGQVNRVVVELTEHFAIEDAAEMRSGLRPLRTEGARAAIDDFGAGYASLKHIVAVQPDWLKLDISLTERVGESPIAHALIAAVVAFAERMAITVIAEGIETEDELDALTELGVRYGQGFHLGMPAPLEQALSVNGTC